MRRLSDLLTFVFCSAAGASLVSILAGCETFEAASTVATTPNPSTGGKAPLEHGLEGVGEAIASPFSYTAWAKIFAAIGAVVGGTYGAKKLLASRAETKELTALAEVEAEEAKAELAEAVAKLREAQLDLEDLKSEDLESPDVK